MPLRKLSQCHQEIIGILYKVAEKLNLSDIDHVIMFGCEDIDIFVSGVYKVYIKGIRDSQKVKYTAIVKWHGDPKRRQYYRELYRREYIFYRHFVPQVLDIQNRFGIIEGLKIKFLNCVYANIERNKESIVILEDDRFAEQVDRFHEMDFVHASLVMQYLAKLHGLSFVMEKTNPAVFRDIKKQCCKDIQYSDPEFVSNSLESYYNVSVNVVCDLKAKEQLKAFSPKIIQVLNKCTTGSPYSTICHADCWNNNIIYKYQNNKPVDVLFVDYQLCRFAPPVTDISYFFYMSTDRSFLEENYDRLLDIYYGTLTAVLRQCNMNANEVYPRSIFKRHLKIYSVFGLIEALVSMKIITAAAEEAFKLTEKFYNADALTENITKNQSLYVKRVNGIVKDFFDRGYALDDVLID